MSVITEFRNERKFLRLSFFDDVVDVVAESFTITREQLFSKSKKPIVVDARRSVMFICYINSMPISYIKNLMASNGFDPKSDTIKRSLAYMEARMAKDNYFHEMVYELYNLCLTREPGKKLREH